MFPHLFINSAADWTHIRPRMISEREGIDRILYNYQGTYTS